MALKDSLRNKLQVKVFDKIGSDATLYTESSITYDEYGSKIEGTESEETIKIVPYNLIGSKVNYVSFGDLEEGDTDAVVPYDTTISIKQKVKLNDIEYEVKSIEDYLIENEKVAIAIRLAKILA
jgi:hypothetical protein